jgi:anti-sigma factor RsiW
MRKPFEYPLIDSELGRHFDGELLDVSVDLTLLVDSRLEHDRSAKLKLYMWNQQRVAIRRLYIDMLHEPIPIELMAAVTIPKDTAVTLDSWYRLRDIVASLAVTFNRRRIVKNCPRSILVQSRMAHITHTHNVRGVQALTENEERYLARWLSKKVDKQIKIPSLLAYGFRLVEGLHLPSGRSSRVLLLYQDEKGHLLTLHHSFACIFRRVSDKTESSFKFSSEKNVACISWSARGTNYVVSASVSRKTLATIANSIFRQVS